MHRRLSPLLAALALSLAAIPVHAGESQAPAFTLRSLDGRLVRLSDYKGKAVVLDFWATWCKPCKASMPHLNTMQDRFSSRLVVVGVSIDDGGTSAVKRFTDDLGIKFKVAMADERVLDAYGPIRSIPTTFFINRKGEIARRVVGYIDPETMETYVKELF